MQRSFWPLFVCLILSTLGCSKDKHADAPAVHPSDALSSNGASPCAQIGTCQRPLGAEAEPATSTVTSTSTSTHADTTPPGPPSDTTPPTRPSPPTPREIRELNDTQKMAKNAELTCKGGDCDPSVGLLSIVVKDNNLWNAGQCTASLVAPDVIATNGHCVPPDLAERGSSCRDRLWITFAKDPAHPEYDAQLGCGQVLLRHKDAGMDGADYAFLKLERASNRPPLRLSQAGFENGKAYRVHKINPGRVQGGVMGMLEKVSCLAMYDSALFPAPLDSLSQTELFVDCEIIPGNSGSPILAEDGAVRGLIYAYVKKEQVRAVYDKNGSSVPKADELADLNTGSNFACLATPGDLDAQALAPACANPQARLAEKRAAYNAAKVEALRPAARKLIAENEKGHPDIEAFGWTLELLDGEATGPFAQGIPSCVNDLVPGNAFVKAGGTIHRPTFSLRASYDRYLRASAMAPLWGGFARLGEVLGIQLGDEHLYQVRIDDPDSGQTNFQASLGACSAE